jgi:hypothetical protein
MYLAITGGRKQPPPGAAPARVGMYTDLNIPLEGVANPARLRETLSAARQREGVPGASGAARDGRRVAQNPQHKH